ncbi:MAG: hypothetical protein AB8I08_02045 [Sandaracinaceae bacterium]
MRNSGWSLLTCALVTLAACDTDVPADAGTRDAAVNRDAGGPRDAGDVDADRSDAGARDAAMTSCDDGVQDGDETDVDCGGACPACANGASCGEASDCLSGRCVDFACASPEGTHPDILRVDDVAGRNPGGRSWADSYSVDGHCYCESTFDHNISDILVDTPVGVRTVRQVCDAIGPGPGSEDRPLYNDIQCGNGPANDAGDEDDCPGRVDIGRDGCGHIGPRWDLSPVP